MRGVYPAQWSFYCACTRMRTYVYLPICPFTLVPKVKIGVFPLFWTQLIWKQKVVGTQFFRYLLVVNMLGAPRKSNLYTSSSFKIGSFKNGKKHILAILVTFWQKICLFSKFELAVSRQPLVQFRWSWCHFTRVSELIPVKLFKTRFTTL